MAYTPFVSVVVAVFNAEKTLDACIRSLLKLDYPKQSLEFVIVDNGSTDGTGSILEGYRDQVQVLYESKRGPAAARNRGAKNASGEIIAFTDSDCIVDEIWLRSLVAPLADRRIGIAGGKILSTRPCNVIEKFGEIIHDHEKSIGVWLPPYVITMNWAARLSVLRETGWFDEDFRRCEDVDLAYRIHQAGYGFAYVPQAVIYHHNESTLHGLFREGFQHGYYSVQVLKKHKRFVRRFAHSRLNVASYRSLVTAFSNSLRRKGRPYATCELAFGVGKKIGKVSGSLRFAHFDL
jgi:mycofactocin glycosyltransferase